MKIEGRNITYGYPGEPLHVFSGLNFSLEGPGFISLFGLSGTGKSTLARIISGELKPETGTMTVPEGYKILYSHNAERFPGWCSVGEHIASVTPSQNREFMLRSAAEFGIESVMHSRFRELSMGEKNRVNVLRYLVQAFDMLIADEVLANVDEPTRNHILAVIKRELASKTFLYISHNAIEVARFSEKILVLPVNSISEPSSVKELSGLDVPEGNSPDPEILQEFVVRLLQTAASGTVGGKGEGA